MTHAGTHDTALVALSILIATLSSYTALDLASRIRASRSGARYAWLATAALAMGGGIWAMHFVAMLAFSMPGMPVSYDASLTLLSFVLPVLVTGAGFHVMSRESATPKTLALSGLFVGLSIVGMHYTGMAAMRMAADLRFESLWVAVSVLIAIGASTVALWLAFQTASLLQKILAAVAMGLAISGMHYASMQGAIFTAHAAVDHAHGLASMSQSNLALAVAAATFLILFLALVAAMFDRRFAEMAEREGEVLRQSEERFRTLYRRTPLPLHSLNGDGLIEFVSDAWLELLGYSREVVIGRPLTSFMTGESAQKHLQVDWPNLLAGGQLKDLEYQLVTSRGAVIDVVLTCSTERRRNGQVLHVLGGLVDVTARKTTEEALRQAQKMEAIGHLTGGVAHDFNNLLAVILGNLDLLKRRLPEDPRTSRLLNSAIQGAQRGASLTQRMLAFARRQELTPVDVEVPSLVHGLTELFQHSVGPTVQIDTRFPIGLPCARVDLNQVELALLNLVRNARDAMPDGGAITVAAWQETVAPGHHTGLKPGQYVCLSVSDTGEGMDHATLSRAMEPFFTTKGTRKGTGLGLSMVHGLAAQSGGRLLLKSTPKVGTTAEIWLPAVPPKVETSVVPVTETVENLPEVKPLAVLSVDDDALVRMNIVEMLEDLGHTVSEAASGTQALSILRSGLKTDLVVTDHAMPGMTGAELIEVLRAERPDLPVLLATGYADLPEGVDAHAPKLKKPFAQTALARAIGETLQAHAARPQVVPFRSRKA